MATPDQARTALKTKFEADFPKFVTKVNEAIDTLGQEEGEFQVEIDMNKHKVSEKEDISLGHVEWYIQSLGFECTIDVNKKILVWVSPV